MRGGGATFSNVLGDGIGFEEVCTISGGEGGDFAQGEFGEEIIRFVGDHHGEFGDSQFQAIEVGRGLGLDKDH